MKIGNLPPGGELAKINKWYIGVELQARPPYIIGVFQPWLFIYCVKWSDLGEFDKYDGREERKIGGWRTFVFPYAISISIRRGY